MTNHLNQDVSAIKNEYFNRILKGIGVKLVLSTYCVCFMSLNSSSRDSFPDDGTKSCILFWIQTSYSDSD